MDFIKLYSRELLTTRSRTVEELLKVINDIRIEHNLGDKNEVEYRIIEKPKNKILKFTLECSFYSNDTLKEMEEDKKKRYSQ